jgi:putative ABC transport system ATP-binding protein
MIQLHNINKIYQSLGSDVHALKDTNLKVDKGENVVLIGKSGSGKSTLLNIISGIDRPSSGNITVNAQNLNELNENQLACWRGWNVGIVFQFYQLLPTLSTLDNILFAMSLVGKIPGKERTRNAMKYLEQVGLESKLKKLPNELSGGERQRVAIARALANSPSLIIADEPTGNLDSKTGAQIDNLFKTLNQRGTTILTVTHAHIIDQNYDKVFHLEDGVLTDQTKTLQPIRV